MKYSKTCQSGHAVKLVLIWRSYTNFVVKFIRLLLVRVARIKCLNKLLYITPYSVQMRQNTDQKSFKYGQFSHSVKLVLI